MSIYYVRHGETIWNSLHRIQGRIDIPLSETGIQQAKKASESFKDIRIDACYSSPLRRAFETACILTEGKNIPVRKDSRIIEMNYGDFDGKQHDDPRLAKQRLDFVSRYPNGESYLDVAFRVYDFLNEIKASQKENRNILIVAHLGIARVVQSYFTNMTNDEFFHFRIDNCQILKYEISD